MFRDHQGPLGAIAVIAAGVGLAGMVFALADAYVLRPLPYADPDRLVSIGFNILAGPPSEWNGVTQADVPTLSSWRARADLFEDVAAFEDRGWLTVQLSGRAVPLRAVAVTDNLLDVLGMEPRSAESDPSAAWVSMRVATMMSNAELQPGSTLRILPEGMLRVRSILPRAFLLPEADRTLPVDVLVLRPAGHVLTKEGMSTTIPGLVARTRPGVTPQVVEAALSATMPAGRRVWVTSLSEALTARLRGLALGALLAGGLVVVVCWTNVFNIALTCGLYRVQEIAIRTALGATPSRIVTLLLTQTLKIATVGGACALAVAWAVLSVAVRVLPPRFATLGVPSITSRVAFAVVLAGALAGGAWGVASILAWRLGAGGRHARLMASRDSRAIRLTRFAVVAGQLGAASVLLAAAALLGRSYLNLVGVDLGMDDRTATMTVAHDPNVSPLARREIVERILATLRRANGVQAAGVSGGSLLDGPVGGRPLVIAGRNEPILNEHGRLAMVDWTRVAGDYFDALGLQFLAGGPPRPGQPSAAVITESMTGYFRGRMPIGELISNGEGSVPIVGVVRDVRSRGPTVAARPAVYEVGNQPLGTYQLTTYFVRVADTNRSAAWEQIVRRADPMALVVESGSVRERLNRTLRDRTFATIVVGVFSLASVLVSALGLAGVVAYTVVKRTREIAIRLALGATGPGVIRLVVGDTLMAGACGILCGFLASVWLSSVLESLLYGIRPADMATRLLAAVGLIVLVIGAAIVPAIRAASIAPVTALRIE